MSNIRVTVVYLGRTREAAGTKEDAFELTNPADIRVAFSRAITAHPELAKMREMIRLLLNGQWASEDAELNDGDRLALLPPIGGG